MDATKKLINLQIASGDRVWNRCLLLDADLIESDIEYYYKTLLGFQDAVITIHSEEVPADFNKSLLSINDSAPSEFPANDLETPSADVERREKYNTFLHQLCEMERSRVALKFSLRNSAPREPTYTSAVAEDAPYIHAGQIPMAQKTQWVKEILKELNAENDYDGAIVSSHGSKGSPYAWIFTPSVSHARKTVGSRVILDAAVGEKWERLLGTYIYPDIIVSRRISSSSWVFKHKLSDQLVENIVQWYLASQDAKVSDGISTFVVGAETVLFNLFAMFRRIKVSERFLTENQDDGDVAARMYKLLTAIETHQLMSADENASVQPISYDAFLKYVQYIFKASNIPRDEYYDDVGVDHVLNRWVKDHYGFKAGADPILSSWKEMWDCVMRGKPTAIKVNLFLASMDSWDPVANAMYSTIEKASIAQEWVRIFMDTQAVIEPKAKIKSIILYEQIRLWIVKFIPEHIFTSQLTPMVIGPVLSKKGYDSRKTKDGRFTYGVRLRIPVAETPATSVSEADMPVVEPQTDEPAVERNIVQFTEIRRETEEGKTQKRIVQQTLVAEEGGTRIEHFFKASVTQEIHLGNI